jgi:aminoglycoside phosphotransferase (APT) family kinase protein
MLPRVQPWRPEHPVDRELARRLVAERLPGLRDREPEAVGTGWDVDVWRFGDVVVRFPRRALGVRAVDNELLVLPLIADRVTLPVPRPREIAEPALGFPSRFYTHAYLPGAPANRTGVDDPGLARLAEPLGKFVAALHAVPLPPLRAAGLRDDHRGDHARVAERGRGWLAQLGLELPAELRERAAAILDAPVAAAGEDDRVLVHGDLHPGNVLVDEGGAITAVIDWGDCSAGDPAIDLAIGLSALPPAARGDFLVAHGDVSPATWARARINAVARHGLAILAWARDTGDDVVAHFAAASLRRAVDLGER